MMCAVCDAQKSDEVMEEKAMGWGPVFVGLSSVVGESTLSIHATRLGKIANSMAGKASERFQQWERTEEKDLHSELLRENEEFWREYTVLRAWSMVFEAASVFQEYGATSVTFSDIVEYNGAEIAAVSGKLADTDHGR